MAGAARRLDRCGSRSRRTCSTAPCRWSKAGGRIAYVTCSVLQEENGDQVAAFLQPAPRFFRGAAARIGGRIALGERRFMFCQAALMSDEGLLMTPRRTETDGFMSAVMRQGLSRTGRSTGRGLDPAR